MEIICINDTFTLDTLKFYKEYGVSIPAKDKIYTIRDIIQNVIGKKGVLLEEIRNPGVPIKDGLGQRFLEPNWDINRFRNIDGSEITISAREWIKVKDKLEAA